MSSVHNPETIAYRNSSNYENCHIKFSLNIFSNQITISQISFDILYLCRQTNIYLKSEYLSLLGYFPFYFTFLLKWKKKEIFNTRIQERDGCRERFLAEVTGNSASDHYARNIYTKVFLEIAVLWILVRSRILNWNISKFVWKYLQQEMPSAQQKFAKKGGERYLKFGSNHILVTLRWNDGRSPVHKSQN